MCLRLYRGTYTKTIVFFSHNKHCFSKQYTIHTAYDLLNTRTVVRKSVIVRKCSLLLQLFT